MAISKDTEASSSITNDSPNAPGRGGATASRAFTQGASAASVEFFVKDYIYLIDEQEFRIVTEASQKIILGEEGGHGEKGGASISE